MAGVNRTNASHDSELVVCTVTTPVNNVVDIEGTILSTTHTHTYTQRRIVQNHRMSVKSIVPIAAD